MSSGSSFDVPGAKIPKRIEVQDTRRMAEAAEGQLTGVYSLRKRWHPARCTR